LIYDVFGWIESNKNVFRICDNLALNNFVAVMPDFFRNNPWPMDKFPPSKYQDEWNEWWSKIASYDVVEHDIIKIVAPYLKKQGIKKYL